MQNRNGLFTLILAYLSFIGLGMLDSLLGVAWPSIREGFGLPLDALGVLLIAGTVGFFLAGVFSGQLVAGLGMGPLLVGGQVLRTLGALGYGLAPGWGGLIVAGLLAGTGAGLIDSGLNNYVSARYSAGRLNWLHAAYGIGATLGPLLFTALLDRAVAWQVPYRIVGVGQVVLLTAFLLTLPRWRVAPDGEDAAAPAPHATVLATLRLPAVWLGIALFFLYTGVEVSAGQWAFTLFTEGRGVAAARAGFWVSVYWATFTAGRILLGFIADGLNTERLLRASLLSTAVGAVLLWWNPLALVGFLGLALMGLGMAPIYPGMIALTPRWAGRGHTSNAIGFQVGAASLGVAGLPALAGVLAERAGLWAVAPFLLVGTAIMYAVFELGRGLHRTTP